MLTLAIDSSGPSAGVALMKDQQLCYEATVVNGLTHSVNLMPMVEEALSKAGFTMAQLDLLAAVAGPGSFTGVRIGVSAVKAMAQALDKPCIGINALEALAEGLVMDDRLICPIRDARVGQVYGAAFLKGERQTEDLALKLPEFIDRVAPLHGRLCFVGDGVLPLQEQIIQLLGERASFAPPHLNQLKAGAAAMIACRRRAEAGTAEALAPLYLRQPQAERERQARG